jgi:hypothetical protein
MAQATPERRIPRKNHERALQAARQATSPPRPPRITRFDLAGRIAAAGVEKAQIGEILDNLTKTGHLFRYDYNLRPEDVPDDQNPREWYTINEDPWLLDWARLEAQTDDPNKDLIGTLNEQRQTLRADDESDDDAT